MNQHPGDYRGDTASKEQVRELLFGAQLKDMETRFQRQEKRFQREIADSRNTLKTRLDSLENFMKSEVASLLHRLKDEQSEREEMVKAEQRERAEAVAQLSRDLAAASENFERKLAKLSGALDNAERELRQLLQAESGALSAKAEERYQDALDALSKTSSEIRRDMVYRSSFSTMLTEMAVKLSGQWLLDVTPGQAAEPIDDGSDEAAREPAG
jgi:signal transduction histidine kinase